jgi:hypothetical protein
LWDLKASLVFLPTSHPTNFGSVMAAQKVSAGLEGA